MTTNNNARQLNNVMKNIDKLRTQIARDLMTLVDNDVSYYSCDVNALEFRDDVMLDATIVHELPTLSSTIKSCELRFSATFGKNARKMLRLVVTETNGRNYWRSLKIDDVANVKVANFKKPQTNMRDSFKTTLNSLDEKTIIEFINTSMTALNCLLVAVKQQN